jgi:hypothetical protein
MLVEPLFYNILVGTIFLLVCGLLLVVGLYFSLSRKALEVRRQHEQLKDSLWQKEAELMAESDRKAKQIIKKALGKAAKIEEDAHWQRSEISKVLARQLGEVIENYRQELSNISKMALKDYQNGLVEEKDDAIKVLKSILNNTASRTEREIQLFQKNLNEETISLEDSVRQKIEEAYQKMLVQIEEERQRRLKKLEEEILGIVKTVTEASLGRSFSLAEHEELIFEALEKAKKKLQNL